MAELFEVKELVEIAVEDERTGVAFYARLANRARDAELQRTFADLAEQERYHQKRFERMLADLGGHKPREQYPGEYMAYLRTLTNERAFPDEATAMKMADQCPDDAAAIALASRFERDTLMLMHEMRSLVPQRDKAIVDELTREEQAHLVTLAQARRRLK